MPRRETLIGCRRVLLRAALLVGILAASLTCDSDQPTNESAARKTQDTQEGSGVGHIQSADPPAGRSSALVDSELPYVKIWRRVADDEQLPPELIDGVSALMTDALDYALEVAPVTSAKLSKATIQEYTASLREFIKTHREHLLNESTTKGTRHWLVFCVGEAFLRTTGVPEDPNELYACHIRVVQDIVSGVRKGIQGSMSEQDYAEVSSELEAGLSAFGAQMLTCIQQYQGDYLFPSFRKSPSANVAKRIDTRFGALRYPKYEEPDELMVSKKLTYLHRTKAFLTDALQSFLFDMFVGDVESDLRLTRYWGYMRWGAESIRITTTPEHLSWPGLVRITPDKTRNRIEGWTR